MNMGNDRASNTGDFNSGDYNSGDRNSGDYNSGDFNSGDRNSRNCNSGDYNTGDYNTGDYNAGDYNTGNYNSRDYNTGNYNAGDYNTGNYNAGDCNTGDYNAGDWNATSCSAGCFNTEEQQIMMFNKPSDWTLRDWLHSEAREYLRYMPKAISWVRSRDMTEEEKADHPEHETTGGYLKVLDKKDCAQAWWDSAEEHIRDAIMSLPNFDYEIFKQCTGIDIRKGNFKEEKDE